ncbi:MAG: hypothetical protein Q4F72_06660 [Desulfovibrionaceae bacterium]|nr:hypothetical protein [Desulfovibrionaceae bacterium]
MDPVTAALIFGLAGICLVWTLSSHLGRRWQERRAAAPDSAAPSAAPGPQPEAAAGADAVYRKLFLLRLSSLCLCLVAAGALYLQLPSALALLLAGAACVLQFVSFRLRSDYLRTRRLVPEDHK